MLTTLAILSSHIVVALLARKRKMGFTKALFMSFFLTPVLALPIVLKSQKLPSRKEASSGHEPPQQQKTADGQKENIAETDGESESEGNRYGYREGGRIISDSVILSETGDDCSLGRKVPEERRYSVEPYWKKDSSLHV